MGQPLSLFVYFQSLQSNKSIFRQTNVKNVHPVSGARIQTHSLLILSILPEPLDQGSRSYNSKVLLI